MKAITFLMFVGLMSVSVEAGQCKLTIRKTMLDGAKKVEVEEIEAPTNRVCKQEAKTREINSEPESVKKIQVTFGFRAQ